MNFPCFSHFLIEFLVTGEMAMAFYRQKLSGEDLAKFADVLSRNSHFFRQCQLWDGAEEDKCGYGLVRITHAGKRLKLRVHRLAFYLSQAAVTYLEPSVHVSHLCHNKRCILPEHLSYEPASVNIARNSCRRDGECKGHRGFRRCVLDAVNVVVTVIVKVLQVHFL